MYRDLIIYVGNVFAEFDWLEQMPKHVPAFKECICVTAPREAAAVLAVLTPGCIIIDEQCFSPNELLQFATHMKKKGSKVLLYSRCSDEHTQPARHIDHYVNRVTLVNALKTIAKRMNGDRKKKVLQQPQEPVFATE